MVAGTCPRCGAAVSLHEGRPFVTTDGVVELWHARCFDDRDVLVTRSTPADFLPTPPTPRLIRVLGGSVVGSLLVAIVVGQWAWGEVAPPPVAALANVVLSGPSEPLRLRTFETVREQLPARPVTVETDLEARHAVPEQAGRRLDEAFPSLRAWTHPVTGSAELIPAQASRLFGAHRDGIERAECREGHCGVDLDGPRGRPIVAVAAGTVVRVELSEMGLDGKSGRYVRIQHDDGALTSYMHMDKVAPLRVGARVAGGQYVGTLGATAIYQSTPHLHFSLEIPLRADERGDATETRYADPAPFLVRSVIAPSLAVPVGEPYDRERRRPVVPAF